MPSKKLYLRREALDGLLSYAKSIHPDEAILLLRGEVKKDSIVIKELVIPPLATHGEDFSSFPVYMLPADASILGVAHSHPSGTATPSLEDLTNVYGAMMLIVAYPYDEEKDIAIYDKEGDRVAFTIV